MSGLRAIAAILGAASGFDAQKGTTLDIGVIAMPAMNLCCPEDQLWQGKAVDFAEFVEGLHRCEVYGSDGFLASLH
jgi:hypothetical protein